MLLPIQAAFFMDNSQLGPLQQYLWFPLIVSALGIFATAFLSYFWTNKLTQSSLKEDKRIKTIDLTDKFLIEISKLLLMLVKLGEDVKELRYFNLKNVELANSVGWKLKNLVDSVTLYPDQLRRKIIENIDTATSLIDEIDKLERYPLNEYTQLQSKKIATDREYRELSLELLKMGIYVEETSNNTYEVRYINNIGKLKGKTVANDKPLKTAEIIRQDLNRVIKEDNERLNTILTDNTNKRNFLAINLSDAQKALRDLIKDLNDQRANLIAKKRHFEIRFSQSSE